MGMTNEEMSLKTKRALVEALKQAMTRKKLSKITVNELVSACNINRKTFYYHFHNVYDLLKWMLEQEAIEVVKNFDLVVNTEEALRFIMDYVDENRHIINGAFDSMGYEEIKRFFFNDLLSVSYSAIEQEERQMGVKIDPQFKIFLADFYTEAAAGLIIEWTKNQPKRDKETILQNLLSIYRITIPAILWEKRL